mmetsp:Transcript_14289/g.19897  ORF Transcript_14289/g.19897 Transcript_14289/m.19897 type:complete len:91 (+) Transcript_14289:1604-1876(+)
MCFDIMTQILSSHSFNIFKINERNKTMEKKIYTTELVVFNMSLLIKINFPKLKTLFRSKRIGILEDKSYTLNSKIDYTKCHIQSALYYFL